MRKRHLRPRSQRPTRKLWTGDPMMNPRPGSSEQEEWETDFEDWMLGNPGSNVPPGGVP